MKRDKTIKEELKEIAPFLASLERINHLKVPRGYFEENEKKLVEAALIEEKVKKLRKIIAKKPFEAVPVGYFDNLPSAILGRVKGNVEIKVIPVQSLGWKQWLHVAAAIAAIVILALPLIQNNLNTKPESIDTALQKVSDDDINSYLSEGTVSMSDEELAKHISNAKLEQATANIITEHTGGSVDQSLIDLSQIDANDIQNL